MGVEPYCNLPGLLAHLPSLAFSSIKKNIAILHNCIGIKMNITWVHYYIFLIIIIIFIPI